MIAESTSPVGRGTAGLLLINGIPPPFSGTADGLVAGRIGPIGAGLGVLDSRGWKGQGYAGEDETIPPVLGNGAAAGGWSGVSEKLSGGGDKETVMASFCPF